MNTPRVELPLQLRPASGAAPAVLPVRRGPDHFQPRTVIMWTEQAIATALDGCFFLTDGTDKNAKKREEEERIQRQRAELVRQRMKKAVEEVVVKDPTDPSAIIKVVAYTHGVGTEDILSRTRAYHITRARQHACALIRELSRLSYPAIARIFGLSDHTTVCHACKTWARHVRNYTEADAQARKMLGVEK